MKINYVILALVVLTTTCQNIFSMHAEFKTVTHPIDDSKNIPTNGPTTLRQNIEDNEAAIQKTYSQGSTLTKATFNTSTGKIISINKYLTGSPADITMALNEKLKSMKTKPLSFAETSALAKAIETAHQIESPNVTDLNSTLGHILSSRNKNLTETDLNDILSPEKHQNTYLNSLKVGISHIATNLPFSHIRPSDTPAEYTNIKLSDSGETAKQALDNLNKLTPKEQIDLQKDSLINEINEKYPMEIAIKLQNMFEKYFKAIEYSGNNLNNSNINLWQSMQNINNNTFNIANMLYLYEKMEKIGSSIADNGFHKAHIESLERKGFVFNS